MAAPKIGTLRDAIEVILEEAYRVERRGYFLLRDTPRVRHALAVLDFAAFVHADKIKRGLPGRERRDKDPQLVAEVRRLRRERRFGRRAIAAHLRKNGFPKATEKVVRSVLEEVGP